MYTFLDFKSLIIICFENYEISVMSISVEGLGGALGGDVYALANDEVNRNDISTRFCFFDGNDQEIESSYHRDLFVLSGIKGSHLYLRFLLLRGIRQSRCLEETGRAGNSLNRTIAFSDWLFMVDNREPAVEDSQVCQRNFPKRTTCPGMRAVCPPTPYVTCPLNERLPTERRFTY